MVIGDKRRYRELRQGTTATRAVPADLMIIPLLHSLQPSSQTMHTSSGFGIHDVGTWEAWSN